jgi:hypothetical protein
MLGSGVAALFPELPIIQRMFTKLLEIRKIPENFPGI